MKKLLFLLIACICFFTSSHASHFVGGDIEYRSIGMRSWTIRLTLYRDCRDLPICNGPCGSPCSVSMNARPASNSLVAPFSNSLCSPTSYTIPLLLNLIKVEDAEQQIIGICPSRKNECNNMGCAIPGNFTPSVEKYIFEGTLNLNNPVFPPGCKYWEVTWEQCCRNFEVSNIQNPGGTGIRLSAVINTAEGTSAVGHSSNSPKLTNEPFMIICGGQEYFYNMGAVDPDGDSLSYSLAPALDQGGDPVSYLPPFTASKPLPYDPNAFLTLATTGFVCDPHTGTINFMPLPPGTNPFVGVLAVEIKQWRRKSAQEVVLVGITRREIQTWIVNCPANKPPDIVVDNETIFSPTHSYWEVPAGDSLGFKIWAFDTVGDSTIIIPDTFAISKMPGATLEKIEPVVLLSRYRFSWKPTLADIRSTPYTFSVNAYDNKCPVPGRITRTFSIKVVNNAAVISFNATRKSCFSYSLQATIAGTLGNAQIKWKVSQNPGQLDLDNNVVLFDGINVPTVSFPGAGKYLVASWIEGTGLTPHMVYDTIDVTLPFIGEISGNQNPLENSTEIYSVNNPPSIANQWIVSGDATVLSTTNTLAEVKWGTSGIGQVKVIATDFYQCKNADSIPITIQQTTGLKEPLVFKNLQLFPNPVQSVINIESPAQTTEPMIVRLFDVSGKEMLKKIISAEDGKYDVSIHVNHLSRGIYFISIGIGSQEVQRKVELIK